MSISLKLLLLALLAILITVMTGWIQVNSNINKKDLLELQFNQILLAQKHAKSIDNLQRERDFLLGLRFGRNDSDQLPDKIYRNTDIALKELLTQSSAQSIFLDKNQLSRLPDDLAEIRIRVNKNDKNWRKIREDYAEINQILSGLMQIVLIGKAQTHNTNLFVLSKLVQAIESAVLIKQTLENSVTQDKSQVKTEDLLYLQSQLVLYRQQISSIQAINEKLSPALFEQVIKQDYRRMDGSTDFLMTHTMPTDLHKNSDDWLRYFTSVIPTLKSLEKKLFNDLELNVQREIASTKSQILLVSFLSAFIAFLVILYVFFSISSLLSDLGRLSSLLDKIVLKEDFTVRLPNRNDRNELSLIFIQVNKMLNFIEKLLREKETLASMDPLTGIMNRRSFLKFADRELSRSKRYHRRFCLLILDIDHFKSVNDRYGHRIGDEVLKNFSNILKDRVRGTDFLARWGGEEFIILSPETNLEAAVKYAEDLRKAVNAANFSDVEHISCSIGIAQYNAGESFEEIFNRADAALYKAKMNGRNCVCPANQFIEEV